MVRNKQRGFTLIELVVVIVILGILAAFAVPRFMGLEGDARASTVKNFGGALLTAATMARAKCQAQDCGAAGSVTIDGQPVTMINGYPNAATIQLTLDMANAGFTPTVAANNVLFRKVGGGANCFVRYTQAANANARPTIGYAWATPPANASATVIATFNNNLSTACRG
jgi:MSHA pilin protein MshA